MSELLAQFYEENNIPRKNAGVAKEKKNQPKLIRLYKVDDYLIITLH